MTPNILNRQEKKTCHNIFFTRDCNSNKLFDVHFRPTFTSLFLFLPALQLLAILVILRVNSNLEMETAKGKTEKLVLARTLASAILKAWQDERERLEKAWAPVLRIYFSKMADIVNKT